MSISEDRLSDSDLHILSLIDELSGNDVLRGLRSMALTRLSQIERDEEMTLSVLKDCLHVASQNLQDARIADLEARVDDLESPEPSTWYETITDAVLVLAAQLVLFGVFSFGTSVAVGLGSGLLMRANLFAARRATLANAQTRFATAFKASKTRQDALARKLADATQKYNVMKSQRVSVMRNARRRLVTGPGLKRAFDTKFKKLGIEKASLSAELEAARKAHGSLENLQKHLETSVTLMQSVSRAFKSDLAEYRLDGAGKPIKTVFDTGKLKDFLENENVAATREGYRSFLVGRVTTLAGDALVKRPPEDPDSTDGTMFMTSDVLNDLLAEVTMEQSEAKGLADQRRTILQLATNDELIEGPLLHEILFEAEMVRDASNDVELNSAVGRKALVGAAEIYLWYQYLSRCGLLARSSADAVVRVRVERGAGIAHTPRTRVNGVHGSYQLAEDARTEGVIEGSADVLVPAQLYHGAPVLSENIADHLFRRFCLPLLKDNPYGVRIPLERDPKEYLDALKEKDSYFGGFFSTDRAQKIDEMRIIVLQTFIAIFETHQGDIDTPAQRLLGMVDVAQAQTPGETAIEPRLFPDAAELAEMKASFDNFMEKSDYAIGIDKGLWDVRLRLRLSEIHRHIDAYEQARVLSYDDMNADWRAELIVAAKEAIREFEQDITKIEEADENGEMVAFVEAFREENRDTIFDYERWNAHATKPPPGNDLFGDLWKKNPPE